ncbi:MAG: NUDIX domain-containing protein [Bryobacteraceae bacterium]|nr:NUDIX domain-containing protein [Bryobacteraceae bacterium]
MNSFIHKAALMVVRDGRLLLCKKRRGGALILPGGKIEPGETPEQCVIREVREELGGIKVVNLSLVGSYEDVAARLHGEMHQRIRIELYQGELRGAPQPSAEIAELVWFGPEDNLENVAPSLRNKIIPDLRERGLL